MRGMIERAYVVRGRAPFPVDMLGYDGARGASEADRDMIRNQADATVDAGADVEIVLVGPMRPNVERWARFGWEVVAAH